jgi:hypothetical protein
MVRLKIFCNLINISQSISFKFYVINTLAGKKAGRQKDGGQTDRQKGGGADSLTGRQ